MPEIAPAPARHWSWRANRRISNDYKTCKIKFDYKSKPTGNRLSTPFFGPAAEMQPQNAVELARDLLGAARQRTRLGGRADSAPDEYLESIKVDHLMSTYALDEVAKLAAG